MNGTETSIKVSDIYVSRFLRGADLPSSGWLLTVSDVATEELKDFAGNPKTKIILTLAEIEQQLALNATQARAMQALFGGNALAWRGKVIAAMPERLKNGQITIHISAGQPATPAQPKRAAPIPAAPATLQPPEEPPAPPVEELEPSPPEAGEEESPM